MAKRKSRPLSLVSSSRSGLRSRGRGPPRPACRLAALALKLAIEAFFLNERAEVADAGSTLPLGTAIQAEGLPAQPGWGGMGAARSTTGAPPAGVGRQLHQVRHSYDEATLLKALGLT